MRVDYVQHWGDDLIVANAARVSFDKKSEWDLQLVPKMSGVVVEEHLNPKDEKLIHYLARAGHTSCFEHMGATLKLKVPIFIARQIQRHRTFSYNEISRRYVDNPPEFFWPDKWRKRADNVKQGSSDEVVTDLTAVGRVTHEYEELYGKRPIVDPQKYAEYWVNQMLHVYEEMLDSGVAPEQARMVLPQNMYTEFYMSGNLRAWEHFLKLRLDGHAQKEVQDVAKMVEDILQPLFPVSMKALMEN